MLKTRISQKDYNPDTVSAPGDTLQEMLTDRGMTQTELADRLGLTHKTVNEIIRGKAPISHDTSLALETVLGVPAAFWNRYEAAYRESLARRHHGRQIAEQLWWLQRIPWKEAAQKGFIMELASPVDQLIEVLRFFGVASPSQYDEIYRNAVVQWRASSRHVPNPDAVAFWLRRGEVLASEIPEQLGIQYGDYSPRLFDRCLADVRSLTNDPNPDSFVRKLQSKCADVGVAVVFVPELRGTVACGAARWQSPTRPLIQLSLRYKTNDNLWFTFYHEAAHILRHSKKALFLDAEVRDGSAEEAEANQFAEDFLIPPRDYTRFVAGGKPSKLSVERFAAELGIHPGIVVGRLQHEGVLKMGWFQDLKQHYVWQFDRQLVQQ